MADFFKYHTILFFLLNIYLYKKSAILSTLNSFEKARLEIRSSYVKGQLQKASFAKGSGKKLTHDISKSVAVQHLLTLAMPMKCANLTLGLHLSYCPISSSIQYSKLAPMRSKKL